MKFTTEPKVGIWYRPIDNGEIFQVVAFDSDTGSIALQYFDGFIDEIGLEIWYALAPRSIARPEDWTAQLNPVELRELGYGDTVMLQ